MKRNLAMMILPKTAAGFISLKMNAETFEKRLLAQEARIPVDELTGAFLASIDITGFRKAEEKLSSAPISLIFKSSMSITEVHSEILRMSSEFNITIVALVQMNKSDDAIENIYMMLGAGIFMVLCRRIGKDNTEATIIIVKRWGPLGAFKLRFLKEFLMFEDTE